MRLRCDWGLLLVLVAMSACRRSTPNGSAASRPSGTSPFATDSHPGSGDALRLETPAVPADAGVSASSLPATRTPDPEWQTFRRDYDSSNVEWVDADVIRVRTLDAVSVEANEIRCPRIVHRMGGVALDMGWRRLEGDVVEMDKLYAHHVTARLIIAEQITALAIRRRPKSKTYRWGGSGGEVRNRVVSVDPSTGVSQPLTAPR